MTGVEAGAEGAEEVRGKAQLGVGTDVARTEGTGKGGEWDRELRAEVPVDGGVRLGDGAFKGLGGSITSLLGLSMVPSLLSLAQTQIVPLKPATMWIIPK